MTRSSAEDRLTSWFIADRKVFKYIRHLVPTEYLVFSKESENHFKFHASDSTYKFKDLDMKQFALLMIQGELAYDRDFTFSTDTRSIKTGNCVCGSWILTDNEYLHTEGCPRYRRDR